MLHVHLLWILTEVETLRLVCTCCLISAVRKLGMNSPTKKILAKVVAGNWRPLNDLHLQLFQNLLLSNNFSRPLESAVISPSLTCSLMQWARPKDDCEKTTVHSTCQNVDKCYHAWLWLCTDLHSFRIANYSLSFSRMHWLQHENKSA